MKTQLFAPKKSPLTLGLNPDYKYFSAEEIPSSIKEKLIKSKNPLPKLDGIILPVSYVDSGALPLFGSTNSAFVKLVGGCKAQDLDTDLSREDLNRLCSAGFIKGEIDGESLYGAAISLAISSENQIYIQNINTDALSAGALNHAERLDLDDPLEIQGALYLYNHFGIFNSNILNEAVQSLSQFVKTGVNGFIETPPPKENPEWHFFNRTKATKTFSKSDQDFKVYISPAVAATKECLRILRDVLPQIPIHTWKIGRGHLGLSRPDKICLYFTDQSSLKESVATLKKELSGIEAQGVPFTFRHDSLGLISSGADIPRNQSDTHAALSGSWRVWIASRLAMAMHLNRRNREQVITSTDAALLSMKFLGINPNDWAITNSNFWRH